MRGAGPRGASPREWVDAWRSWLGAAGWPGSRPLDSGEFQAREAWERTLGEFASLSAVTPRLTAGAALDALRALAGETIFQPEGGGAPIQILGVLEGTGHRLRRALGGRPRGRSLAPGAGTEPAAAPGLATRAQRAARERGARTRLRQDADRALCAGRARSRVQFGGECR